MCSSRSSSGYPALVLGEQSLFLFIFILFYSMHPYKIIKVHAEALGSIGGMDKEYEKYRIEIQVLNQLVFIVFIDSEASITGSSCTVVRFCDAELLILFLDELSP